MAYFNKFPTVEYDVRGDGNTTTMTDITRRVRVSTKARLSTVEYDYYDVIDGQTPEFIADRYYGDVGLHWLVLMTNDIIDVYNDWPMSVQRFEEFVKEKYDNPQAIHHYEITQTSGDTSVKINVGMNTTDYSGTAISSYTYEDNLQEKKRQIRLIQPRYIKEFVKEFERKLDG